MLFFCVYAIRFGLRDFIKFCSTLYDIASSSNIRAGQSLSELSLIELMCRKYVVNSPLMRYGRKMSVANMKHMGSIGSDFLHFGMSAVTNTKSPLFIWTLWTVWCFRTGLKQPIHYDINPWSSVTALASGVLHENKNKYWYHFLDKKDQHYRSPDIYAHSVWAS